MRGPKPAAGYRMNYLVARQRLAPYCVRFQRVPDLAGRPVVIGPDGNHRPFCRICSSPLPASVIQESDLAEIDERYSAQEWAGDDLVCSRERHAEWYAALREREMRAGVEGAR